MGGGGKRGGNINRDDAFDVHSLLLLLSNRTDVFSRSFLSHSNSERRTSPHHNIGKLLQLFAAGDNVMISDQSPLPQVADQPSPDNTTATPVTPATFNLSAASPQDIPSSTETSTMSVRQSATSNSTSHHHQQSLIEIGANLRLISQQFASRKTPNRRPLSRFLQIQM